jgi:Fe2+ transport system protein B
MPCSSTRRGFVVFLALMFVVFQALFAWSDPAITPSRRLFGALGDLSRGHLRPA